MIRQFMGQRQIEAELEADLSGKRRHRNSGAQGRSTSGGGRLGGLRLSRWDRGCHSYTDSSSCNCTSRFASDRGTSNETLDDDLLSSQSMRDLLYNHC